MKERPILFSAPMIRAILSGAKTQTRRVAKIQPDRAVTFCHHSRTGLALTTDDGKGCTCKPFPNPYGVQGDRLWVRETWVPYGSQKHESLAEATSTCTGPSDILFKASATEVQHAIQERWFPAIHMPRWASRITLKVTDVRVERIQDISEEDAKAEGAPWEDCWPTYRQSFEALWTRINGAGSWDENPWVYAVSFERVQGEKAVGKWAPITKGMVGANGQPKGPWLVTNNPAARNAHGGMSHVWVVNYIGEDNGEFIAFDCGDRKIYGLKLYAPICAPMPPIDIRAVKAEDGK